jgi:D-glycero-D-manno-heptose 1,7-bisphosphate phosphatase
MGEKALFLDRDGVINVDHGYVYKIEDFQFTKGIFELLHLFLAQGYSLFIVTNQSGIGRGYYSKKAFLDLTTFMLNRLKEQGITIQEVAYCPHAPEEQCFCRKPATGMVEYLCSNYQINLKKSWLIGDKQSDIDLAHNAKIGQSIAIGERLIHGANLSFKTILNCKSYLEENQGKIT